MSTFKLGFQSKVTEILLQYVYNSYHYSRFKTELKGEEVTRGTSPSSELIGRDEHVDAGEVFGLEGAV